jgi:putative Mg2+ transporter-C (MgtC) family protein
MIDIGLERMIELEFVARLAAAALLGGLVGLERSIAGKHAGMRTYALVSMGSALFVAVGTLASYQLAIFGAINPLQIAGSIVIGIGFIGSGLAVFRGDHPVELTTASGIWVVAGIGMAAGFGLYWLAGGAAALAIITFSLLLKFENSIRRRYGVSNEQ